MPLLSEAGMLSGTVTRTWHFGDESARHAVQLRHQSVSGYRYVILDGIEVANSEGTSSLLFQSDVGDAIVLELCEKADGDDDVHRQFDDSDSAEEGAGAGVEEEELRDAAKHILVIRIKPTSDGIAYQYACSYDNEPLAETNSLATGGAAANYKITIPVSDVAEEEAGGKVAWYRVDCQRLADKHSTSVCRRFSEFFDLNTDVTSAFVGSPIERRLPTFPSRGIKLFGLALTDHYSSSFVESRRASLEAFMARLAACPTVDSNPEFLRFVDMADQFKKLEVKVLMSGDADETSDLLGDEIFSEDVSRPGEVSVSFDAGSLGLSLRAVESGEGSAARRVEAPAVVLGFTGRGGQAEISKVISKGDFVSRVGGVSVMPGAYADIIHMLKTAPRPIVVHFVKGSYLPHIEVDLTPTWKTAAPKTPTGDLVALVLPKLLDGPWALHITLPAPSQRSGGGGSEGAAAEDAPTIGVTAEEVEVFDRLFIDAGAHRERLPTEIDADALAIAAQRLTSAAVDFVGAGGHDVRATLAFVPDAAGDAAGAQLALFADARRTAAALGAPGIVPCAEFGEHPIPVSAGDGNTLIVPTEEGSLTLTLAEGANAREWVAMLRAMGGGGGDEGAGEGPAAESDAPLRLDGGGRGGGARQETGAAWFRRSGLTQDELRTMWRLACGGKAARALRRSHFFLALKLVAAAQSMKAGLDEASVAALNADDVVTYSRVLAAQKGGESAGMPTVLGVLEGGAFVVRAVESGTGDAAASTEDGAASSMFKRPSSSRDLAAEAGESEASGFL